MELKSYSSSLQQSSGNSGKASRNVSDHTKFDFALQSLVLTLIRALMPIQMLASFSFSDQFEDFWAVNQKLMLSIKGEAEPFKNVPFCIYRVSRRH